MKLKDWPTAFNNPPIFIGFGIFILTVIPLLLWIFKTQIWQWFALCSFLALLVLLLWKIPQWQVSSLPQNIPPEKLSSLKNDLRKTLAQILGGIILIVGFYGTWKTIEISREEAQVSEERQITERFTRAIDQLGSDKLKVRLGGIYALERIANDSPKDHWQIMEILTAFVREDSPWRIEEKELNEQSKAKESDTEETQNEEPKDISKLPTDIQAILTIIGRRTRAAEEKDNQIINLSRTNLYEAELVKANLRHALLYESCLRKAYLFGANMEETLISNADLRGANLREVNLKKARLYKTNFQEALLIGADLQEANMWLSNLQNASLEKANLQKTDLWQANIKGAILTEATLRNANLREAVLQNSVLYKTDLQQADLTMANLQRTLFANAILKKATLSSANLIGSHLIDADLQGANFGGANMKGAVLVNANLQEADLIGTTFEDADLRGANLQGALLRGTDLREANLLNANLTGARDLTVEQLSKVKTLYGATMDTELRNKVKDEFPHLLEKPSN